MDNRKERIQPAVRKETEHVMVYTAAGVAVMWCVFLALHLVIPEKVPFDYTGDSWRAFRRGAVAALNFFLMGMAVAEKPAAEIQRSSGKAMDSGQLFSEEHDADAVVILKLFFLFSLCS